MVYESSFSGIIRIIFWIILVSFIIRLVARMALPLVVKKAEQKMRERAQQFEESQRPPRNEGEVTIEKPKRSGKGSADGEYTDYIEVKD
jgi:hypothetical protein